MTIKKWSINVDRGGISDKAHGSGCDSLAKTSAMWLGSLLENEPVAMDEKMEALLFRINSNAEKRRLEDKK